LLRILFIISLCGLAACIPKVEETKVNLVPRTQGGSVALPGRWSAANLSTPLQVNVSSDLSDDFIPADLDGNGDNPIVVAMKNWNATHPNISFFKTPVVSVANKESTDLTSYRDGELGIYRSDSWFPGISSGTIAITQFYGYIRNSGSSDSYIDLTHADIIVNYRDHSFSTNPNSFEFDIETVILHELGHFIGIKHPTDYSTAAVMQSTLAQGEQKRTLLNYDTNSALTNYSGYNPNLTTQSAGSNRGVRALSNGDQEVSGYYELKMNGDCLHWLNDQLVEIH
tara:strand:+ start:40950 stop:41798 length:849 start_codon:yes stop_codon:yes gene_type:complete